MSFNFIILKHVVATFLQRRHLQKYYNMDFIGLYYLKNWHAFCKTCENCQKLGSISKRNMMHLNPIIVIKIFDYWEINCMGSFPSSFGFVYTLVVVDYVSK